MYSFENETVAPPMVIAVAVKKGDNSTSAVEWALENFMSQGGTLILLHVRQRLLTIPTPVGNIPISLLHEDAVLSYVQEMDLQINEMLSTYRQLCNARKVKTMIEIIEHYDVASAIIQQISSYGIGELVIGSSSSNAITRRFKYHDVPEIVLKNAPNFCTVHIAPKRKLSSAHLSTSSKEFKIRNPEDFSNQTSGFSDMTDLTTLKDITDVSQSEEFIHAYSQPQPLPSPLPFQRNQSLPINYHVPRSISASNPASTISNVDSGSASISMRSQTSGIGVVYDSATPRFSTSRSEGYSEHSTVTMSIEGRESPGNIGLPRTPAALSIENLPFEMENYTFSRGTNPFNFDTASSDCLNRSLQPDRPPIFSDSLGGGHGNVIDEMKISPRHVKTASASNNEHLTHEQNVMMEVEWLKLELERTQGILCAVATQEATKAKNTANEIARQLAEKEGQERRAAEIRARIESGVRKKAPKAPESKRIYVQSRHIKEEMDAMPPKHFVCPILLDVMDDPHMAADGFTYEHAFIRNWLEDNNKSPITNQPLQHKFLTPNHALRSAILEWKIKSGFNNVD